MVKLFPSLRGGTDTKVSAAQRRAAQGARGYLAEGIPYGVAWSVDRAVREGMELNTWVYKPVDAIASRASSLNVGIREGDKGKGPMQDPMDPYVHRVLNVRSNPHETAQALRYRTSGQVLLSKKGVFVEVVLNRRGRVAELNLLPVDRTNVVPAVTDQANAVAQAWAGGFVQQTVAVSDSLVAGFEVSYQNGDKAVLPPFDASDPKTNSVLWIRKPHIVDPLMAMTPFEAAGLAIDTSTYAKLFNRNFMANDGRPGGILAVKGQMDPEDAGELKSRFGGGVDRAGRVTVMEAEEVKFVDTATTPRDAQYVESQKLTKDECLIAFGTPESILGNASGRTFDNADAEEEMFWRHTMRDHLAILEAGWDQLTELGSEDDQFVVHDLSEISVLQRDQRAKELRLAADYDRGAITLDEYREGLGLEPFNLPVSRVAWVVPGRLPVGSDTDVEAVKALAAVGQAPAPDPAAVSREGAQQGAALGAARAARQLGNVEAAAALTAASHPAGHVDPAVKAALEAYADLDDDDDPAEAGVALAPTPPTSPTLRQVKGLDKLSNQTGIMVCLVPDDASLERIDRVADTPRDQIHLTLAYLGQMQDEERGGDDGEVWYDDVEQAVRMSAQELAPMRGEVSGWTRFKAGDDGRPTVALLDVPGLGGWRESLAREVNRGTGTAAVTENHGFAPHVTLGFDLDEEGVDDLDSLEGLEVSFDAVYLVWGERWERYPLEGDFDGSLVQQVAAVEGGEQE